MPTVSVVIATYNRARWIPATLRSVLAQTHAPLEVLIVDDGSTDETEALCRALPAPVRYVRQANGGVSAARNHGIHLAQGEWIAIVDSDDLWAPEKLEAQLAALAAVPGAQWSVTGCDMIDFQDAVIPTRRGFESVFPLFRELGTTAPEFLGRYLDRHEVVAGGTTHVVYGGDAYEALFAGNFGLPSSCLVHRELLARAGAFDPAFRLAEETEFFHRLAAHAPVAVVATPLVGYRIGQEGSLISPKNVDVLVANAIESGRRAAALRAPLSGTTASAHRAGRERLLRKLAYTRLTKLDSRGARAAVTDLWRGGGARDARTLGLFAASLLPVAALRAAHAVKRSLGGAAT